VEGLDALSDVRPQASAAQNHAQSHDFVINRPRRPALALSLPLEFVHVFPSEIRNQPAAEFHRKEVHLMPVSVNGACCKTHSGVQPFLCGISK
jgi:hypothetical protein